MDIGGKQHKASCKAKAVSSISQTLQLLHMDLFGPTSVRSLNHKTYCLVITDDFSRFSWVFFLRTKDETSAILKDFIRQIENQLNQKVKTIRSDNGTEFKNKEVIEFCGIKGIKREYSNARTPQQNGVAERKNRTLIEAARTMLADSFLPNTFWAEAVSTACYVLNRVLVTKPHNKTPYELLTGKIPIISYIRPFGCHVTILNTIDHLGKFAGKSDEGFLVGYSLQSKAFRVYNLETKRVEENLHITFLENKPNVAGKGPTWLFDLDYLTDSMNYHPVSSENQANLHAGQQEANQNAGTEEIIDAGDSDKEDESAQDCFVLPIWPSYSSTITPALTTDDKREGPREEEQVFMDDLERLKRQEKEANEEAEALRKKFEHLVIKEGAAKPSSTNIFSTVSTPAKASSTNLVNTVSLPVSTASSFEGLSLSDPTNPEEDDSEIPPLEDIYQNSTDGIFTTSSYDDEGAVADFTNLETVVNVSPIPTSRIHSTHPKALILGDPNSAVQTRSKVNTSSGAHAFVSYVQKQKRTSQSLISLLTTISISSTMAVLDSCPKHKMVAYLEKSEGNVEFHEIIDFLKRSSIHHALTISDQAKEIQALKAQITKLKKQAKPVIKHHKAYLTSVSLKQRFLRKSFSKKHRVHKESVSKQGRKFAKGESSVQRDPLFDEVDHMETENAQNEGRTREMVDKDKEIDENILSTEEVLSTDKEGVSTDMDKVSTDRPIVSTDGSKVSTDRQIEGTDEQVEGTEELNEGTEEQIEGTDEKNEGTEENFEGTEEQVESTDGHKKGTEEEIATQATQTSTQTPTSMIFGDDETIAKVLLNMSQAKAVSKEKEKGVELKDVEETDRPNCVFILIHLLLLSTLLFQLFSCSL
ncbi:putative ribonuclease H-like domain-containing protein [Tanacetum coccineum]|uniref:Ribonuclease H-like domain-containing protein n=1 Tax=Tanacetum coccineum TaxID=301880 RepID=A0ABQ5ELN0_9ASTR